MQLRNTPIREDTPVGSMTITNNPKSTVPTSKENTVTEIFVQKHATRRKTHEGSHPAVAAGGGHHVQAITVVMGAKEGNTPMVAATSVSGAQHKINSSGSISARARRITRGGLLAMCDQIAAHDLHSSI